MKLMLMRTLLCAFWVGGLAFGGPSACGALAFDSGASLPDIVWVLEPASAPADGHSFIHVGITVTTSAGKPMAGAAIALTSHDANDRIIQPSPTDAAGRTQAHVAAFAQGLHTLSVGFDDGLARRTLPNALQLPFVAVPKPDVPDPAANAKPPITLEVNASDTLAVADPAAPTP